MAHGIAGIMELDDDGRSVCEKATVGGDIFWVVKRNGFNGSTLALCSLAIYRILTPTKGPGWEVSSSEEILKNIAGGHYGGDL